MASVVPALTMRLSQACREYLNREPLIVDSEIKTGVRIKYEEPASVGADRIADAVAVLNMHGAPAVVVDFGTATTFDAINADGDYLGGAIAPGIGIASEALFAQTAKLPRVNMLPPPSAIGRNTVHAMQSGLLFGYVAMVEGMVARFRAELGSPAQVIATGGLAELVVTQTNVVDHIEPWLTLEGLRFIWELNR